ncbi:MAG: hypothetical protein ACLP0J_10115 [Solirubrobacteraceae bacterium]
MDTDDLQIDLVGGDKRHSATAVNGDRVPSWAMSSLTSVVASIDERLAALAREIDRLHAAARR